MQYLVDTLVEVAAAVSRTEPRAAAVILGGTDPLQRDAEFELDPTMRAFHLDTLSGVRSALDDAVFQAAWEEGRSMNGSQLLVRALAVIDELAAAPADGPDKAS